MSEPGRNPDEATRWLAAEVSRRLGVPPDEVPTGVAFSALGLDSAGVTGLVSALAVAIGRPLPATVAFDHPTVEALARYVSGDAPSPAPEPLSVAPSPEPVAIVGMACRFPQAPDLTGYWRLLYAGEDAITGVPPDRWDPEALVPEGADQADPTNIRWGGFVDGVDRFDPGFFGLSPRETRQLDPQQRIMLELAHTAFEDAGVAPVSMRGSRTGVFVGAQWSDYARLYGRGLDRVGRYTITGQDVSIIAARVSYTFGLRGPSLSVATACSSSLVAVHLAVQSLQSGESRVALAGGINLVLAPESTAAVSRLGALGPTGRCRSFAAAADGYVRGEGGGFVVLKRLSAALADGDRVYAVIHASAVNNDGFSNGLTAPNPVAQEELLREVYARSGIAPDRVQYVEAHGTGTILGDPIEAGALGAVLRGDRDRPLLIGTAKSNIGHLEAAAGIAGLIKVALAVHHQTIPASLHFVEPNPHIPFAGLGLEVAAERQPWPDPQRPPTAGISSFGYGGTNSHVVVAGPADPPTHLVPLAGADLRVATRELAARLRRPGALTAVADIGRTEALRLAAGPRRVAFAARTRDELLAALDGFTGTTSIDPPPMPLVFVCSGGGSQWVGMGRDLMRDEPVFRAEVHRCDQALREVAGWSVLDTLAADRLAGLDVVLPTVFAVQVGLAALWRSWGIEPDAVLGHSMGEAAAAYVSGALSLPDATRVIHHYGRLMHRLDGQGAMAVVDLSVAEAERVLRAGIVVAGVNSPDTTVLSGAPLVLDALLAELEERGTPVRKVALPVAGHSPQCTVLEAELAEALSTIGPMPTRTPMTSTVTGAPVDGEALVGAYWRANLRQPVLFGPAVERLLDAGPHAFLELSPHPVLTNPIERTARVRGMAVTVLPSMRRDRPAGAVLRTSLARLYALGRPVRWRRLYPVDGAAIPLAPAAPDPDTRPRLLPLSAHSPEAVRDLARTTSALLAGDAGVDLDALCGTAGRVRGYHEHRLAVGFRTRDDLIRTLDTYAADGSAPGVTAGRARRTTARTAFVFTGQGSQWAGMGARLLADEPVFREAVYRFDRLLREHTGWSVAAEIGADARRSRLVSTEVAQPAIVAVQIGLCHLWRSWGIEADAVVGHSVGEIAAAYWAGVFDLVDAARIAHHRGRLMQRATGCGRMAAVGLTRAEAEESIVDFAGRVCVAAVNGPASTVLSGATAPLDEVLAQLVARGVFVRRLATDYAFHSPQMTPYQDELAKALSGLEPRAGHLPIVSTMDGDIRAGTGFDAAYWGRTVREPVLFAPAVQTLVASGCTTFVEVGPHPALAGGIVGPGRLVVPSLRRDADERATLLGALGALYASGHRVDWDAVAPDGVRPGRLPGYPWQKERYWLDAAPVGGPRPAAEPWLHEVIWSPEPHAPREPARPGARWCVVGDGPVADAVTRRLREAGDTVVVDGPADGVLYLPGLTPGTDIEAVAGPLLPIVRALARRGSRVPVWLVTRDAYAATGALAAAALWGLGRSLRLEHPDLWGGLIDVTADDPEESARQIVDQVRRPDGEDEVAYRDGTRHVARLAPVRAERRPPGFTADGTYLVTGGLGGIGLRLAGWLVRHGARQLVLVGRRGPAPQACRVVDELRAAGADIAIVPADVSRRDEVEAVLSSVPRPLRGVFHAAGALDDGVLTQLDRSRLRTVLAPKVLGALHLHELTGAEPLDAFVLFSSAAAVLGSAGQANYAAANAALDALARHRRAEGRPGLSVNWGPWAEIGMASGRTWADRGLRTIPPDVGLDLLGDLLGDARPVVGAFAADWPTYVAANLHGSPSPLLRGWCDDRTPPATEPTLADRVAAARPGERDKLVTDHIGRRVGEILGLPAARRIDPGVGLFALGLDSLMAVDLANRLRADLGPGAEVPATLAFDHPTVAAIAALVEGILAGPAAAKPSAPAAGGTDDGCAVGSDDGELARILAEIEDMSEEEAARHLAEAPS